MWSPSDIAPIVCSPGDDESRADRSSRRLARALTPRVAYAIIVLVLLGFGALAFHYHASVSADLTDSVMARRAALAQLAAATLSERLDRMADLAVSLATRVRFAELVTAGNWEAAAVVLREVPREFPYVERLFLSDVRGTLMADVPELAKVKGQNFAGRDWYQGVTRAQKTYISSVYRRTAEPQLNVIAVATPVRDRSSGRTTGILVLQLSLEPYFDWARALRLDPGATLFVVDARGQAAYASGAPLQGSIADLSTNPAVRWLGEGRAGTEVALAGGEREERLYAFVPSKQGWGVVIEQPASIAFAARELQLRFVQIAYALTALLLLAIAWLGMRIGTERRHAELERIQRTLTQHAKRLRILHEIDRALIAEETPEAIAAAVIQPLREVLGVPRAIVNKFDLAAGEVEWMAAAGRRRTHVGPGVRYSIRLMGDVEALRRGEAQRIDVRALPPGPEVDALLASGVHVYMAVPMIAGGELIGALSFGGEQEGFPAEQITIAQEVAAQLAIAIVQARLFERVKRHAEELETANRQLHESEERLNFALHKSHIGGWDLDLVDHSAHRTLEHDRIFGYGSLLPQWTYEMFLEHVLPEDRAEVDRCFREATAAQTEWSFECRIRRVDGEVRWIWATGEHQRGEAGQTRRMAGIVQDITDRKRAEQEIRDLNASLERRVAERTAQLEAANKELEAFTYSVSHDLRAPLRAVDGYARMLEEDYAARLDDEGRRLLAVVRDSSRHMGQLIDDLLEFSRVSKQVPAKQRIDMTALAREVADGLASGTRAAVALAPLPAAEADRALVRQVWANLIGNALKYSGKRNDPRIEIGGREEGSENIYWARDNGAGFDMRYAAKLFGVFQRLHGQDEFPGTGVGLAIVQRVVTRHGGRVWAEGRPDEGACFFFSLPRKT